MNRHAHTLDPAVVHLVGPGKIRALNGRLVFEALDVPSRRFDLRSLRALYCYGDVSLSDEAIASLLANDVPTAFLSRDGFRCKGRLASHCDSATTLRTFQHRALAEPRTRLELARRIVLLKIDSQIAPVRHRQRHGAAHATRFLERLAATRTAAANAPALDVLRGCEGQAAALWFEFFATLLPQPWTFPGRNRRPPRDPVNALLSLGYTWLQQRMLAAIHAQGLEANLGALHDDRPGRPSLACDLVEPHRVEAVDLWGLELCRRRVLRPDQFEPADEGGVRLVRPVFGTVLAHWEQFGQRQQIPGRLHETIAGFEAALRGRPQPPFD